MIYDSSRDYGTGSILILFDGADPTEHEIRDYVRRNYSSNCFEIEIESESSHNGYRNPGTIRVMTAPLNA